MLLYICIVHSVNRRRQLRKSRDTSTIDTPTYDCIGNDYRICFTKNTRGTVGNNNDSYIGLDLGSMQSVETDESRYMALGEGITGRPRAATGSSSPRGRSNTGSSTTALVAVDDEGYASLRIGEVRSTQQLPYTPLSRWGNSDQRRGQNVSEGDVGGRAGADFDQFRSAFEAHHRSSIDTNSNLYETLDTPRPSIDMGVLRKQGSLGENDYEELENMNINPNNAVDPLTSQGATPSPNTALRDNNKGDSSYSKVDDPNMIFNYLYQPSGSDVVHRTASKSHSLDQSDERRTSTYDKVDDTTLMFNNLYEPSTMTEEQMHLHQANGNLQAREMAMKHYRDNRTRHVDDNDVRDLQAHVRGDAKGQVSCNSIGQSGMPMANLRNDGTQEEASSEPTADCPMSPNPYYFCLNTSEDKDATDLDITNMTNGVTPAGTYPQTTFVKPCAKIKEENDKEQVNRSVEDVEG